MDLNILDSAGIFSNEAKDQASEDIFIQLDDKDTHDSGQNLHEDINLNPNKAHILESHCVNFMSQTCCDRCKHFKAFPHHAEISHTHLRNLSKIYM